MTAQTTVQKLIDTFADWLKYIRELNEMYEMNRVLRDMERVCALCLHKRRCIEDLAAGKVTAAVLPKRAHDQAAAVNEGSLVSAVSSDFWPAKIGLA